MTRPFSLVRGGPFHRFALAVRLASGGEAISVKTGIVAALVTWLPLLGLSLAQGVAFGDRVQVPLLQDLGTYARYLVAIPLLLAAESIVDLRLGMAMEAFRSNGLVPQASRPSLDRALEELESARDRWWPEWVMWVAALAFGAFGLRQFNAEAPTNWTALGSPAQPTWAGLWLAFVSLPLFGFVVLRWGWRLFLWSRFLWRLSRLDLELVPTHPDRAGGIGFVARAQGGFHLVVAALSVVFAARAAQWIVYRGESPEQLQGALVAFLVLLALLVHGPLLVFSPVLAGAKRRGLLDYDRLARRYTGAFQRKWIGGEAPAEEPLLGSADIQSLADLEGGYQIVASMRVMLTEPIQLLRLALSALLPMLPLLATVVPLRTILSKVLELLGR